MAGNKRVVITNARAVKALNLMSAMSGEDPSEIATKAVLDMWEVEGERVLESMQQLSPLRKHLAKEDKPEAPEQPKEEETQKPESDDTDAYGNII